jgi:hypothetical protein
VEQFGLESEEQKTQDALEVTKFLKGSFLLKKGGVNLWNEGTEIKLFYEKISCEFVRESDMSMVIGAETKEFGIEFNF